MKNSLIETTILSIFLFFNLVKIHPMEQSKKASYYNLKKLCLVSIGKQANRFDQLIENFNNFPEDIDLSIVVKNMPQKYIRKNKIQLRSFAINQNPDSKLLNTIYKTLNTKDQIIIRGSYEKISKENALKLAKKLDIPAFFKNELNSYNKAFNQFFPENFLNNNLKTIHKALRTVFVDLLEKYNKYLIIKARLMRSNKSFLKTKYSDCARFIRKTKYFGWNKGCKDSFLENDKDDIKIVNDFIDLESIVSCSSVAFDKNKQFAAFIATDRNNQQKIYLFKISLFKGAYGSSQKRAHCLLCLLIESKKTILINQIELDQYLGISIETPTCIFFCEIPQGINSNSPTSKVLKDLNLKQLTFLILTTKLLQNSNSTNDSTKSILKNKSEIIPANFSPMIEKIKNC